MLSQVLGDDNQRLRRELATLRNRPELEGVVFADPVEPEIRRVIYLREAVR